MQYDRRVPASQHPRRIEQSAMAGAFLHALERRVAKDQRGLVMLPTKPADVARVLTALDRACDGGRPR
jgi:hypothetical protein